MIPRRTIPLKERFSFSISPRTGRQQSVIFESPDHENIQLHSNDRYRESSLIGFLLYENGLLDLLHHFGCVPVARNLIYVWQGSKLHTKQKFYNVPVHISVEEPLSRAKNIGYERKLLRESAVALISYFVFIARLNGSHAPSLNVSM